MKSLFTNLILVLSLFSFTQSFAETLPEEPIDDQPNVIEGIQNFREVIAGQMYRGAQPSDEDIAWLSSQGVKVILSLRNESREQIEHERKVALSNGLQFVSVPLASWGTPKESDMQKIQQVLKNASVTAPVFVHCKHGRDRTGLVIGLFRVFSQHVSPKDAYAEMKSLGFRSMLFKLKNYFWHATKSYSQEDSMPKVALSLCPNCL